MSMKLPGMEDDGIVSEINMTPFIDIMLVLLIIFMATTSVSLDSGLDIDLPKTVSPVSTKQGEVVVISLDGEGKAFIQGKKVDEGKSLKDEIAIALNSAKSRAVVLEGDKRATIEKAIEIMDLAKEAGAESFSLAANPK